MDALNLLHTRRSVKALEMCSPGPNVDQLNDILTAGARVPDHGMVVPFYFVVFEGDAGKKIGEITAQVFQKNNPRAMCCGGGVPEAQSQASVMGADDERRGCVPEHSVSRKCAWFCRAMADRMDGI
jgi:nitroreductase